MYMKMLDEHSEIKKSKNDYMIDVLQRDLYSHLTESKTIDFPINLD